MTRRQEIIDWLSKTPTSLQNIANFYKTDLKDILEDVEHIRESIKPKKLKMVPPYCKKCGFVFKERNRIKTPSKCPKCKSEWIEAPLFRIE